MTNFKRIQKSADVVIHHKRNGIMIQSYNSFKHEILNKHKRNHDAILCVKKKVLNKQIYISTVH